MHHKTALNIFCVNSSSSIVMKTLAVNILDGGAQGEFVGRALTITSRRAAAQA